ncbi:hypothetical protein CENSYa_1322 [Cenarchaeum symbiosum A]|uniref:Uncharacterized protein n=1 Tax=Cenarchaeum symbiosum (strain A) TaxID=414004 RepID=A0RX78_CENSY|nr:hypothetical protein CENSYa_1322 [Cenarchaeum symbiosum A]
MPELICEECGKRMFHENPVTLEVEGKIHKKFCRKKDGSAHSYMHREPGHADTFDAERHVDTEGKPVLKK